jgi:predicted RND superfamily exporter protein
LQPGLVLYCDVFQSEIRKDSIPSMFLDKYINIVLRWPLAVLVCVSVVTAGLGWYAQQFRMDASADSLVVEGDADLEYSRVINSRYGTGDFVFVTYTPDGPLFTADSLTALRGLRAALLALPGVKSVDSIFDVPLLRVAGVSLSEVADNMITLDSPGIDLADARDDLASSEAYRDVLLSADGETTALIVNFAPNTTLEDLLSQRTSLRDAARTGVFSAADQKKLVDIEARYTEAAIAHARQLHEDIASIRDILNKYRTLATIYLGGVPMIADDLVTFVRNDLVMFGSAILLFIIAALAYLFHKVRYVLIPLACGVVIATCVIGLLGLLDWPVTVISSNFISLLLIITISLTVHLIVRYRELEAEQPRLAHHERIRLTLKNMSKPCAYTSLTTIVAFGSLVVSDIPPIIDFGWMMVMGICCAFLLTFLMFPAILGLLPANSSASGSKSIDITPALARFTDHHGILILAVSVLLFVFSVTGISRLKVENSFIDYFDENTDIYQGMVAIDRNMGGTTPLDVIVDMSKPNPFDNDDSDELYGDALFYEGFDNNFDNDFDAGFDEFDGGSTDDEDAYWFTSDKMAEIIAIHEYLESLPETGKVLSLATLLGIAYELNDGEPLNSIELGVLYNRIPVEYKESLLRPYVSVPDDQVRFSIRVLETSSDLVRADLLETIRSGLTTQFGFAEDQIHLTGMLVLYNKMLQSLFESQILTLGLVLLVIMGMFLVLFHSWKLALIGIVPNILAALAVLGLMGWLGIPLDMMTITIAAVSVGIGVDNTIHYIHRFKQSYPSFNNYRQTMTYCHGSIGRAMYYTGFTVVAGFSLLVLSNFIPTIYFGLLTSLAMCLALAGALTLLPQLLILFRPLG